MPQITFIDAQGVQRVLQADEGSTAMRAARSHGIPGIVARCGGVCACATCHVYVDEAFLDRLDPPSPTEQMLLQFVPEPRPASRLACQLRLTAALDGLVLHTPERQG